MKFVKLYTKLVIIIIYLSLTFCLTLSVIAGGKAVARDFYVSNQGNDANNGRTPETPWKTIAKVNCFPLLPGDNVFFKRGNIWREELRPKASGLPGKPITFGSYGWGDCPMLYGADPTSGWYHYKNNLYYKTGFFHKVNLVLFDGLLGNQKTSRDAVQSEKDWYWEAGTDRLYIFSAENPASRYCSPGIEVGAARCSGIKLYYESANQQYLIFKDFYIRYANDSGMNFQGVNYLTIDNCTVEASGIKNMYIFDTDYFTLRNSSSFGAIKEHGLYISAGKDRNNAGDTSSFINIEKSQFYNNRMNGIQINPNDGPTLNYVRIHGCKIYDNCGHGILDMGSNRSVYSYNLVYDNGKNCKATQIFLHYNELYYPNGNVSTSNAKIYNNVIGSISRPTVYGVKISKYVKNSVLMNNIFYWPNGIDRVVVVESGTSEGAVLDYNFYYLPNSTGNNFSWGNYWQKTFSEWQVISGQDCHSHSGNPECVNAPGYDFSLSATSPCIGAGIHVGLTHDHEGFPVPFGAAVDIGALEFHGNYRDSRK